MVKIDSPFSAMNNMINDKKGNEQFRQDILKHSCIQVSLTADLLFFFNATVIGKFKSHS